MGSAGCNLAICAVNDWHAAHVTYFRGFEHVLMRHRREAEEENIWTVRRACIQYKLIFCCMFHAGQTRTRYGLACRRVHVHMYVTASTPLIEQEKGRDSRLPTADFRSAPDEIHIPPVLHVMR